MPFFVVGEEDEAKVPSFVVEEEDEALTLTLPLGQGRWCWTQWRWCSR